MIRFVSAAALGAVVLLAAPASAQTSNTRASSSRNMQLNAMSEIPVCQRRLGTIAIVEPDNEWWRQLNLGSPEAIIKIFVQRSGCFGIVNRGRSMQSRSMERALADHGPAEGEVESRDLGLALLMTTNGVSAIALGIAHRLLDLDAPDELQDVLQRARRAGEQAVVSLTATPAPGEGWRYQARFMADRVQFADLGLIVVLP